MPGIGIGISPVFKNKGQSAAPFGDIILEEFNPQVATWTTINLATSVITSGNMALSNGNSALNRGVFSPDVIWNGNNWYLEYEYECTVTTLGRFSCMIGLQSINNIQKQGVSFGVYYFDISSNNGLLYMYNGDLAGPMLINNPVIKAITINVGDRVRVRGEFIETTLTVTVTNLTTPDTVSDAYTYLYTLAATEYKPNTGRILIAAGQDLVNIKKVIFGTLYLKPVDRMFMGDSITSGYFQVTEGQRFVDQYEAASGKSVAIMAGAGDRSFEVSNSVALAKYTLLKPKKVLYFAGTNDIANGFTAASVITQINLAKAAFEAVGSQFFVAVPIPRDGVSLTALRTLILATYTNTIDWYSTMENSMIPGNLNPLYTPEAPGAAIHPNVLGATTMSNFLIANGF